MLQTYIVILMYNLIIEHVLNHQKGGSFWLTLTSNLRTHSYYLLITVHCQTVCNNTVYIAHTIYMSIFISYLFMSIVYFLLLVLFIVTLNCPLAAVAQTFPCCL